MKEKIRTVIFGTDTKAGKWFDLCLIYLIVLSVIVVILDSTTTHLKFKKILLILEWTFTLLFTIEYGLRIFASPNPKKYVISFLGIIDLISFIPSYLSIVLAGSQSLIVIRLLRILRIFRILKLSQYLKEINFLLKSILRSVRKIVVFLFFVFILTVIFGSIMYLVEGPENGFSSIPRSIYWAIVTMTTVGYGDISPRTNLGQTIAALVMIIGYSIIAVPTGIVSAELSRKPDPSYHQVKNNTWFCLNCRKQEKDPKAKYCKYCSAKLV